MHLDNMNELIKAEERPEHLRCTLKPGEAEFIRYHNAYKEAPKGWEPLMALGGHLWRAALIRRKATW